MDERNEVEKVEDMILPGFRFHPTDEELVGFYLKRKVQQKPLSIELIRQLNIYKYDPWDLPKLATSGEKEWYFYCPRDRKYRNSARPNRVTGAGFWKATGTDRPIYSSEGCKCIGLKKSLVFYQGRAAKGMKTDWMMHEFRLPSVTDASLSKRPIEKNIPINDSWAICRIFKKTSSMAQRVLSQQSWPSPPPELGTGPADLFSVSCTADAGSTIQFAGNSAAHHNPHSLPPTATTTHYPTPAAVTTNKPISYPKTSPIAIPTSFVFPGAGDAAASKPSTAPSVDVTSMLLSRLPPAVIFEDANWSSASIVDFGHRQQQLQPCFTIDLPEETSGGDLSVLGREIMCMRKRNLGGGGEGSTTSRQYSNNGARPAASLCPGASDGWRPNAAAPWDSPPCPPSEVSLINLVAELDN